MCFFVPNTTNLKFGLFFTRTVKFPFKSLSVNISIIDTPVPDKYAVASMQAVSELGYETQTSKTLALSIQSKLKTSSFSVSESKSTFIYLRSSVALHDVSKIQKIEIRKIFKYCIKKAVYH